MLGRLFVMSMPYIIIMLHCFLLRPCNKITGRLSRSHTQKCKAFLVSWRLNIHEVDAALDAESAYGSFLNPGQADHFITLLKAHNADSLRVAADDGDVC